MDFGAMINRVLRAAQLDVAFFNEAEADTSLNQEALMVVILVAIAGGIGGFLGGLFTGQIGAALLGLIVTIIIQIVSYYVWAYVTYFVGTNLFQGTADPGELLRVIGYAYGPRVLSILSFIPCVGAILVLVGAIWSLVASVIGIREALDFDTTKAVITVIIGWVIILIISFLISAILGVGAMGAGALMGGLGQG